MHLPPGLQAVQDALDQGNAELARSLLLRLGDDDRRALAVLLGEEQATRVYRNARRSTRAIKRGRVVVLPGITGSELVAHYGDGKSRVLWVNFGNLLLGRTIGLLTLKPDGTPDDATVRIAPRGFVLNWYLNLVTSLQTEWDVLPVSYDWRLDIDRSADSVASRITAWARGEPVHIVAHSMGGLVSRRMLQRHPELWSSMDDPDGRRRGGRLVMLGTPNRGAFAIPLTLTGEEFMVRLLDVADLTKGRGNVLARLNTFPGTYQMLPSPQAQSGDHARLFDPASWGDVPVQAPLLQRALRFIRDLHDVVDTDRMIYIAGYGKGTPSAIRMRAPGKFEYQRTELGDGRVPHSLGLLPGVPAYYVREAHGDLPKNERILTGLTDLLLSGKTGELETSPRLSRAIGQRGGLVGIEADGRWHDPHEFVDQQSVAEMRELVRQERLAPTVPVVRRNGSSAALSEPILRAERLISDAAGVPAGESPLPALLNGQAQPTRASGSRSRSRTDRRDQSRTLPLAIEVIWGDITAVKSDVCAVGHYQGVEPQNAELAIDRVLVTGHGGRDLPRGDDRLVLTRLTHRRVLRGSLGEISFFPAAREAGDGSSPGVVAIAGMGYPGSFSRAALQQLAAQLADAVSTLPDAETLSLVLIGSGEGSLGIREALSGLLAGLDQWAGIERPEAAPRLRRVRIVEWNLGKARAVHAQLLGMLARGELAASTLRIDPARTLIEEGGGLDREYAAALYLLAAGRQAMPPGIRHAIRRAAPTLRNAGGETLDQQVTGAIRKLEDGTGGPDQASPALLQQADDLWRRIRVATEDRIEATRLSYLRDDGGVRIAAISDRSTVSERVIAVDFGLIREQIKIMQTDDDPLPDDVDRVARLLRRILLPRDFRDMLLTDHLIFDVDRAMAAVPWEAMQTGTDLPMTVSQLDQPERPARPSHVALEIEVARQLRTTLSPAPLPDFEPSGPLEALVVADPDDSLEHARVEGEAVASLLKELGCRVRLLVGSRGENGAEPASRGALIDFLSSRRNPLDILHYAGHGDFDPEDPTRVGWVFADGILGPNELRFALDTMPPLMVVANSCLTGRISEKRAGRRLSESRQNGKKDDRPTWDEFGLIPALADIFFQRGVRHFIAANRPIYDEGAADFASVFYRQLLSGDGTTVGSAILAARRALHQQQQLYGPLWAAYHHYGDPRARLRSNL